MLINVHNDKAGDEVAEPHEHTAEPALNQLEEKLGSVHGGAICQLAENAPDLQQLVAIPNIRAYAITATGAQRPPGAPRFPLAGALAALQEPASASNNFLSFYQTADGIEENIGVYLFTEANDGMVRLESQTLGGGIASSSTPYSQLIHTPAFSSAYASLFGITKSPAAAQEAFSHLDSPTGLSSSLPPVPSTRDGVPRNGVGKADKAVDRETWRVQCAAINAPMNQLH
jgi:hypothetical protein